jgi:glutamate N-acetyltransferase / amino-acid N-acetyltransferase
VKTPLGYRYAATYAGIRKQERDDLALIVSETPAAAAAIFTRNRVQAAPVKVGRQHLRSSRGKVSAVVINAGNANCATRTGEKVAVASCKGVARHLKVPVEQVIPSSTGVIGVELDEKLILNALPGLVSSLSPRNFGAVSQAIMTTDTHAKVAAGEVPYQKGMVHISGMAKGAGMIQPNMATTLNFIMTDAAISPRHLQQMLTAAAERSFHRLSVDGDTSTNDTVLLLANGASGVKPDEKGRLVFQEVLAWVMEDLAEMIARDGEGARKLISIFVHGTRTDEEATGIARAIANSLLVKTAIAGCDPNWGRILSAAGNAGVEFDPAQADIYLQGLRVCHRGLAAKFSEAELKQKLNTHECVIKFDLAGKGKGRSRFWTCDLTPEYVNINASYRT